MSQRGENEIMREEMRFREKIIAERCMDMVRTPQKKFTEPRIVEADITIHVATHMKDNPGPGAYAVSVDDGSPVEVDYLADTTGPHLELVAMNAAVQRSAALPGSVVIYTTTANTANYLNNGQAEKWKANGWRKADGDRVKHWDLWAKLLAHYEIRDPAIVYLLQGATPAMKRCANAAKRPLQPRTRASIHRRR